MVTISTSFLNVNPLCIMHLTSTHFAHNTSNFFVTVGISRPAGITLKFFMLISALACRSTHSNCMGLNTKYLQNKLFFVKCKFSIKFSRRKCSHTIVLEKLFKRSEIFSPEWTNHKPDGSRIIIWGLNFGAFWGSFSIARARP